MTEVEKLKALRERIVAKRRGCVQQADNLQYLDRDIADEVRADNARIEAIDRAIEDEEAINSEDSRSQRAEDAVSEADLYRSSHDYSTKRF